MRDDLQRPAIIAALQEAAQRRGMKDVAAEMDLAPSSLYAACNPYGDRAVRTMPLELALGIMKYTGDKTALALLAGELGCSVVERSAPDKPTVAEESLQDFSAVSALSQAMQEKMPSVVVNRLAMAAVRELGQSVSLYLEKNP